jgi:ribosomal protein S14
VPLEMQAASPTCASSPCLSSSSLSPHVIPGGGQGGGGGAGAGAAPAPGEGRAAALGAGGCTGVPTPVEAGAALVASGIAGAASSSRRTVSMCERCGDGRAAVKRSKDASKVCRACFFHLFEEEIYETIVRERMFKPGEKVCVAASGGKDSTVLAEVMTTLNARHDMGLDLHLLSIDEVCVCEGGWVGGVCYTRTHGSHTSPVRGLLVNQDRDD